MTTQSGIKLGGRGPDGLHVRTPTLSKYNHRQQPGIITSRWMRNHLGEFVRPHWYFQGDTLIDLEEKYAPNDGGLYWIEASEENMRRMLKLPDISEADRAECHYWLNWRGHLLPSLSVHSLLLKIGASLVDPDESVHRHPGFTTRKKVKKKITHTPEDILKAMFTGEELAEFEENDVEVFSVFAACLVFLDHTYYNLYSQQLIAAWYLYHVRRAFLQMDMRTGKTAPAIAVGNSLLDEGEIDQIVVICPTSNLMDPWLPELEKHGLRVAMLDGTVAADRDLIFDRDHNCYLLNFERVRSRLPDLLCEYGIDPKRTMLIGDETSKIKNPHSKRSIAFRHLAWECEWVAILNGTPMQQGPQDLWAQYNALDPYGLILGNPYGRFINNWLVPRGSTYVVPTKLRPMFEATLTSTAIRYIRTEADQFSGQDKSFRYIQLPCTEQQLKDTKDVADGFVSTIDDKGNEVRKNLSSAIIALYLHMREIGNGYNKIPINEDDPANDGSTRYLRLRYDVDPKVMFLQAYIESNPTVPLILFTDFNEQEQAIKEMLNTIGVKWSSTRPLMRKMKGHKLNEAVSAEVCDHINNTLFYGKGLPGVFYMPNQERVDLPTWMRFNDEIVQVVRYHSFDWDRRFTEEYVYYDDPGPHKGQARSDQIAMFNRGETNVFILKPSQGYGLSLHRKECWSNGIGVPPVMFFMCPVWSLGDYEQSQDRAVTTDERTGLSTNTMIYALSIKGSIEDKVLEALRLKKDVQSTLLQDTKRKGFSSFVTSLVDGMAEARADKTKFFDADEMRARGILGVSPTKKITKRSIFSGIREKYNLTPKKAEAWLASSKCPENIKWAYDALLKKVTK